MSKNINFDDYKELALDGGVLIALAIGEEGVSELKERILLKKIDSFTSNLAITELLYILCRKLGWKAALEKKQYLIESKMIDLVANSELLEYAAQYKCTRAIALADCFTLATAKVHKCPALFIKKEKEISDEIEKQPFDVDLKFCLEN